MADRRAVNDARVPAIAALPRRGGQTKAATLAGEIRRTILTEGLRPGDALPSEAELIARHGLARATVREAIRILAEEALIEVRIGRRGGIYVSEPEPQRLGELLATQLALQSATVGVLMEFRRLIEPVAAGLAAERANDDQLRLLHEAVSAPSAEEELDFHLHVADASGNALLAHLLRAVHTGMQQHGLYAQAATPSDVAAGRRTHRRLYEAIVARDADRARELMGKHLQAVEVVVRRSGRLDELLGPSGSDLPA
ncbi:MAG: FadR/GntR family transcriptional regulator [Acidimicrobiales bacterium]